MTPLEKHYTLDAIAKLWAMSYSSVRRLFMNEAGVIVLPQARIIGRGKYKRKYEPRRVPESVLLRVHERLRAQKK